MIEITNPHGDVLGTIPDTSGATTPTGASDYDEYGNTIDGASAGYGWIGGKQRPTNPNLGLVQMGVRAYNPATGQFTSVDPVYGGNPTPYTYPTDPVEGFDLNGKCGWVCALWHVTLAAATVASLFVCSVCDLIGYGLVAYSAYRTASDVRSHHYRAAGWDSLGVLGGVGEGIAALREARALRELRAARGYSGSDSVMRQAQSSWRGETSFWHRRVNYWHTGNVAVSGRDLYGYSRGGW